MTVQYINTGSGPNAGNGDSLRSAFTKINNNFAEITATLNSSLATVDLRNVPTDIIPELDATYHLGSTSSQWKTLFISSSSVYIGGNELTVTAENGVLVNGTPIQGSSTASTVVQSDVPPQGSTSTVWYDTVSGKMYVFFDSNWVDTSPVPNQATTDRLINGSKELVLNVDDDRSWIDFPAAYGESITVQGSEIGAVTSPLTLFSSGHVLVRSNALDGPRKDWQFDKAGTLTLPTFETKTFTATLNLAHYTGNGTLTLTNDAWHFVVTFEVSGDGTVDTIIANNTPWINNPGYANDMTFEFTESDHGIPNYTLTLLLVDIQNPGSNMWTTNLTASQPPAYPRTLDSGNTLLLHGHNSVIISTAENIHEEQFKFIGRDLRIPQSGDIKRFDGTNYVSVLTPAIDQTGLFYNNDRKIHVDGHDSDLVFQQGSRMFGKILANTDSTNFGILSGDEYPFTIKTGTYSSGDHVAHTWEFGTDGSTTLANGVKFSSSESNKFALDSGTVSSIDIRDDQGHGFYTDNGGLVIRGANNKSWSFGPDGTLIFPDDLTIKDSVIARKLESVYTDGVTTTTNVVGSKLTLTNNSIVMEAYNDPDGPNNTQYGSVSATSGTVVIKSVAEDVAGETAGSITVTGGGISISQTDGVIDSNWNFAGGILTFPDTSTQTTAFTGSSSALVNGTNVVSVDSNGVLRSPTDQPYATENYVTAQEYLTSESGVTKTTGNWTLAPGPNTVSFTAAPGATYTMWVNGNIPNGIVVWNATVTLTNQNVPAIGSQYGWYYTAGNALVLTSMPNQIIGNSGAIRINTVITTTSNVFTFGITNNSSSPQVVNWGYAKIS